MKRASAFSAFPHPGALAAPAAGALFYFICVFLAGGGFAALLHTALFCAAFALCLLGSGLSALRLAGFRLKGADAVVCAFVPGCLGLFVSYAVVIVLPVLKSFATLWLLLSGIAGVFGWRGLLRDAAAEPADGGTPFSAQLLCGCALAAVWGVTGVWGVLPSAHADELKAWVYNQDLLWSAGNAAAVRFGLPLQDLRMAGLTLHYHFLNDVCAGILALGTGGTAWDGLCWGWTLCVQAMAVLGLFCVGRRLAPRAQTLAACLPFAVFFVSPKDSTLPANLFTNANAQVTALAALCGALLLLELLPAQARDKKALLKLFALCVFCGVSLSLLKSTVALLFVLACAAACIVGAVTKQTTRGQLVLTAGFAGGFGIAYAAVLMWATNNLVFTSLSNLANLPAAYLRHFALPVLALYLCGLVFSFVHFPKLPALVLTVNAFAIGGMLAYVLYNHYSYSQVYFALAAVPCVLLSLLPMLQAGAEALKARDAKLPLRACSLALAALLVCGGALQLYTQREALRRGAQAALRCLDLRAFEPEETTVTADDWAATQWLKENTDVDCVFATNRNNKQYDAAEGTFHFYTAASERRCYLESYRYGMDYDRAYYEIRRRLEEVSDSVFYKLAEADAFALAKQEGIDYLVVSKLVPNAPEWQAEPVFASEYVNIYRVE